MISKQDFEAYERVRLSGRTNMFDLKVVSCLSGLSKPVCLEIMHNYSDLKREYLEVK